MQGVFSVIWKCRSKSSRDNIRIRISVLFLYHNLFSSDFILQDYGDSGTIMVLSSMEDMLFGMILGMVASPLLMKLIKSLRQKRKVDRLLKEAAANVQHQHGDVSHMNSQRSRTP